MRVWVRFLPPQIFQQEPAVQKIVWCQRSKKTRLEDEIAKGKTIEVQLAWLTGQAESSVQLSLKYFMSLHNWGHVKWFAEIHGWVQFVNSGVLANFYLRENLKTWILVQTPKRLD